MLVLWNLKIDISSNAAVTVVNMARRRSLWENAVVSLSPFLSRSGWRSWVALRLVSHGIKTAVSHTLTPPPFPATRYGSSERLSGLLEALSGVCDSVSVPLCCLGYGDRGGLPWKQVGGSPPFLFDQFSPVSWKAREVGVLLPWSRKRKYDTWPPWCFVTRMGEGFCLLFWPRRLRSF